MIRKLLILITLYWLSVAPVLAEEYSVVLRAEQWDTLRNGEALLKQPELSNLIQRWMNAPDDKIELRYPGGEEGEVWVHELIDWLVALGVPSSAMQSLPGSGTNDTIYLVLIHGRN